jgi:hypothetical protein
MTRKDYVLIAAAIVATQDRIKEQFEQQINGCTSPTKSEQLEQLQDEQLRGVRRTAAYLCNALAKDNPRRFGQPGGFDPTHFLKACGYGGTTMNPRDPALDLRPLPGEGPTPWTETMGIDPAAELARKLDAKGENREA